MLKLPGKVAANDEHLLKEEVTRLLQVMRTNDVNSPDYANAFVRYKEIHQELLAEKKLKEFRRGRIFDAIVTGVLFIGTTTVDMWTPITSRWGSSFMNRFHYRGDNMNF